MGDNVDLDAIAYMTDGFSGADLQALLSDAQLAAVQELLDSGYDGKSGASPVITDQLLKSIASKAKPSVSESEKHRLYAIYHQFLDAKRSVAAQVCFRNSNYILLFPRTGTSFFLSIDTIDSREELALNISGTIFT